MVRYKTVLADPPWNETGGGRIKRGADKHYPLLKKEGIIKLMKGVDYDDNCHLYLWVTNNFLKDGLEVIEALGFRYITTIAWVKDRFGLGYYFRGQHELLLFAIKGHQRPLHKDDKSLKTPTTVTQAKRRKHSQKPDEQYAIIDAVSCPPMLEMFARSRREGWDAWGNEVPEQEAQKKSSEEWF